MNFLAHIYLSFDDDEVTLGNFIADNIPGNKYKHFPAGVQKGILLHREIDTFTDSHAIPKISSKRLHKNYSHYSRVIVDIFYDHFLAKNWGQYSEVPLDIFVSRFYSLLQDNYALLPERVHHMMPYMIDENWIYNYSNMEGIERVLQGMDRRTHNRSKMTYAISDLAQSYSDFEVEFKAFFKELMVFSRTHYLKLRPN
ncbi:MAG: acyl carrier protein phosphodiesterase [Maribacter sp.]|nr:acyl carrier protein phosphodiesterase [Maribacter sp.]